MLIALGLVLAFICGCFVGGAIANEPEELKIEQRRAAHRNLMMYGITPTKSR